VTVTQEQAPGPVRINLLFNERAVRVPYGVTLFDAASWNGIAIDSTCGGHGTCKKCRIRIADDAPAPTSLDIRAYTATELKDGWRLACRTLATRDTTVEVPPLTTRPKAATVGVGRQVILRPAVQKRYLEMTEPDLSDQASDLERVLAQLDDLEPRAELPVLKTLGQILRGAEKRVHGPLAVRRHQHIASPGRWTVGGRRRVEGDAGGADVVGERGAELVVLDLADIGRSRAEIGDADNGIGGRSARHFGRRTHVPIDRGRTGLVDQRHAAFGHAVAIQKSIVGLHQDIENRVTNPENVVFR